MKTLILVLGFLAVALACLWLLRKLGLFLEGGNLRPFWDAGEETSPFPPPEGGRAPSPVPTCRIRRRPSPPRASIQKRIPLI